MRNTYHTICIHTDSHPAWALCDLSTHRRHAVSNPATFASVHPASTHDPWLPFLLVVAPAHTPHSKVRFPLCGSRWPVPISSTRSCPHGDPAGGMHISHLRIHQTSPSRENFGGADVCPRHDTTGGNPFIHKPIQVSESETVCI